MSGARGTVRKYFDVGPTSITAGGVYTGGATGWASGIANVNLANQWLTSLTNGTGDNQRVGQSIAVETLDLRVKISPDPTGLNQTLRMIVFADNECDGAYPSDAELFSQSTIATGANLSFLQPAYFGRFKIIEDKHFDWQQLPGTHPIFHESHHDLKGHRVMWDTTDLSTISNARKGHIFIFFYWESRSVAAGGIITQTLNNPPAVQYVSRIRYRDE